MKEEMMNDDERSNKDKLDFFYAEKVKCHIVLKRKLRNGKNVWLNGLVKKILNERLYNFQDDILGEIRLSLSEIANNGVEEFREVCG